MTALGWNIRYVRTINSCNRTLIEGMFRELLSLEGSLRRRRYVWNLIRGKNFYIPLANCIVAEARGLIYAAQKEEVDLHGNPSMEWINRVIREVIASEKDRYNVVSFVDNITSHVNLITLDTIPYTKPERLEHMLLGTKPVLMAPELDFFGSVLKGYQDRVARLEAMIYKE